ncbi:MAG: FKBP-type peptidyl-prolyl cis-trans isomerase [Pseudomonadota bacterium]
MCLVCAVFIAGCDEERAAGRSYREASERMVSARAFLSQQAGKQGVERTRSGLLYRIERRAQGANTVGPRPRDEVLVHYRGALADGEEFEASYDRNTPARFALRDVIAGWREGLQLMRAGDRFVFYIPPQLGYGPHGRPPVIPANAVLIYEVELLAVYRVQSAAELPS